MNRGTPAWMRYGSMRLATLATTACVLGTWVYANVISYAIYMEVVRSTLEKGGPTEIPPVPEMLPIPGWVVTLLGAVFGAKQIEKHLETRGVILPPPEKG